MRRNVIGVNPRGLTVGQVRGVVNCMRAEIIRAQREIEKANAVRAEAVKPAVEPVKVTREIPDGFYTVSFAGGHRTFRVRTNERGTWVAFLAGPVNTSDYMNFARIISGQLQPFKRWNPDSTILDCAKVLFTGDLTKLGQAYAKASGNCYVCNRVLTTPESIEAGIGPICAGKRGI